MIRLIVLIFLFSTASIADSNHHCKDNGCVGEQGPPGPKGEDGAAGIAGLNSDVSSDRYNTGVASMIALSNIDFSSSTTQWQVGVAAGSYDSEQALAFGAGKLVTKYDMLFKVSGTVANDSTGLGVGLMWKIR